VRLRCRLRENPLDNVWTVRSTSVAITTDFTESYLTVPLAHIKDVAKELGAVFNRTTGQYQVQCDAKLPSLVIGFRSQQLTVASDSLISNTPNNDGTCALKVDGFEGNEQWLFGSVLARSYCQVFDLDKKQVGFGKVKSK
ncbi:aspartyl protease-like protein, partial [Aphelenchoides avenae]